MKAETEKVQLCCQFPLSILISLQNREESMNTGRDTKIRNLLFGLLSVEGPYGPGDRYCGAGPEYLLSEIGADSGTLEQISGTCSNQNKPNKRFRILVSHPV